MRADESSAAFRRCVWRSGQARKGVPGQGRAYGAPQARILILAVREIWSKVLHAAIAKRATAPHSASGTAHWDACNGLRGA